MRVPSTGKELRRLRHKLALSQEELGAVLAVSQESVSQMESERRPISKRTALLLQRYLEAAPTR